MKTILAEKPSVAKEIAKVLGCTHFKVGYIEGNDYYVTWAFGHLVELAKPDFYGYAAWTAETLPIIPETFILVNKEQYNSTKKEYDKDEGALKQFNIIKTLFHKSKEIIVATDAGREGELIFRYIYQLSGCEKPFSRLWISSLTTEAIQKGFHLLKEGKKYDHLFYSAQSRNEADWLIGLNATRAMSITAQRTLSIGRVQTPTLAIICQRYLENQYFKPSYYYILQAQHVKEAIFFTSHTEKIEVKETAEALLQSLSQIHSARVKEVQQTIQKTQPPLLFDLGALQQEANKTFGYTAEKTLQYAQSLYEAKYLSYPRTSSRYISQDIFRDIPETLTHQPFSAYTSLIEKISQIGLNTKSINDDKITDHHALIITNHYPKNFSKEEEENIYHLVLKQMIMAFGEVTIKDITQAVLQIGQIDFKTKGIKIVSPGWEAYFPKNNEEEKEGEEANEQLLPSLTVGETCAVNEISLLNKKTSPPRLHTDASLLKAMETAGKDIQEEELRQNMKDCGLGTPATRANIIETLIKRSYIERQAKNLLPTMLGQEVYQLVKEKTFASPELTGLWETKLNKIEQADFTRKEFMEGIHSYTKEITAELLAMGKKILPNNFNEVTHFNCPACKEKLKETKYNWQCACGFKLSKIILGKHLREKHLKEILKNRKTFLKGLKSNKTGKLFSATLVLKEDNTTEFSFKS